MDNKLGPFYINFCLCTIMASGKFHPEVNVNHSQDSSVTRLEAG